MYHTDYPSEPIGEPNPYYRCAICGVSCPEINGQLENHRDWCSWAIKKSKELLEANSQKPHS